MSRIDLLTYALTTWHRMPLPLQRVVSRASRTCEIDALEYIIRVHRAARASGASTYRLALQRHVVLTALRDTNRFQ